MSYSFSVPSGPFGEFRQRAEDALAASSTPDDQREAAAQAVVAADNVLKFGLVGGEADFVSASISGHAYTGEGSARPTCNISLRQEAPPAP